MPTKDEKKCPFCKGLNLCQVQSIDACWCKTLTIPASLIALVPSHLQRKSCICSACVRLYNENQALFLSRYLSPE